MNQLKLIEHSKKKLIGFKSHLIQDVPKYSN